MAKIVVVGGTGPIGSKVVAKLTRARTRGDRRLAEHGCQHHRRARVSPRRSPGPSVVVDVPNSPSFAE